MKAYKGFNFFSNVAVCITTYNVKLYIKKAIDSVLAQKTNFDFNIFIFDDQSTDGTWEILMDYQFNFPNKIFIHRNKINIGMMPNFLQSLEYVRSKYIAVLDGDDYWTSDCKLQVQYDFLQSNSHYSLCWHDATMVNNSEKVIRTFSDRFRRRDYNLEFDLEQVIRWKVLGATSSLFFRNYLIKFPEWVQNLHGTEALIFLIWRMKGNLKYIPENYSAYRVHSQSQEASLNKISKSIRNIREEKLLFSLFAPKFRWHFSRRILWNRFYVIAISLRYGDFLKSSRFLLSFLSDVKFLILTPKNETIPV